MKMNNSTLAVASSEGFRGVIKTKQSDSARARKKELRNLSSRSIAKRAAKLMKIALSTL